MKNPLNPAGWPCPKARYFEYAIVAGIFCWFLFAVKPLPIIQCSDGYFLWVPRLSYAAGEILRGRLPLWNPFQFCGTPLMADANTNILSPGIIFYLFLSPAWAYTLDTLLVFLFLLLGAWNYFRVLGFSLTAALIGVVSYGFSGQVLFWSAYHGMNLVFCLLPWALFSFHKFEEGGRPGWAYLSFALTFLMLAGGFVQFALLAALTVVIEGLSGFSFNRPGRVAVTGRIIIVAAAVLSASFILLPVVEAALFSHRSLIPYIPGIIPPKAPFLFMAFFGYAEARQGLQFYFYYTGLVVLALALLGARRHFRQVFSQPFFVYACLFPLIAAAVCLRIIPEGFQFGVRSDPFRGMFVFALALSVLSAIGAEEFSAVVNAPGKRPPIPPELIGAFLAVLAMLGLFFFLRMDRQVAYFPLTYLAILLLAGIIAAFLFRRRQGRLKAALFSLWLIAALALNCFFSSYHYLSSSFWHKWMNVGGEFRKFRAPARLFSGEGRIVYIGPADDNIYYNFNDCAIFYKLRAIGGYGSFFPRPIFLRMREDRLFIAPYHAATHFRNNNLLDTEMLAKYGVAYLVAESRSDRGFSDEGWEFIYSLPGPSPHNIYKNPKFAGRAYVAAADGGIIRPAEIIREAGASVSIFLEAEAGEELVLSDSWFPGWECYDNGKRVKGFDSRGFRGYKIESPGLHIVEWRYRPKSYLYGGLLSLLGLAIFTGWIRKR
jgi:hypothetical protein